MSGRPVLEVRSLDNPGPASLPDERRMDSLAESEAHVHQSVAADRRVWLEAIQDQAATMRLHAYCMDCGAVRSQLPLRGRPRGFFDKALANLRADLESNPRYPKLAQVHSHLIAKALDAVPDFGDPYSMDFETQLAIFMAAVQRVRPDLDADVIHACLPREPRRRRPAFIDLVTMTATEGGRAKTVV